MQIRMLLPCDAHIPAISCGEGYNAMRLSHILLAKLAITATLWCPPLLILCPSPLFNLLGIPRQEPLLFIRLLGAAYLALMVAYWHGWIDARAGRYPRAAVHTGLMSNGLAAATLAGCAWTGTWGEWGIYGQVYMWVSLAATTSITVGLVSTQRDPH